MRLLAASLVLLAISASAQEATPAASPPPPPPVIPQPHSGAPLGQFTAGPFIVTPTFKIGTIGFDTNVYYLQERNLDFVAAAGPGLDIALPFLDHWKFDVLGISQYFYFYETKELRRWTGGGTAALLWETTGTRASLSTRVYHDFSRPSFEVDARVASRQTELLGTVERDLGRLTLGARGSFNRMQVDPGQEFRGADLSTALTTDRFLGELQLQYRVTPLSALLFEGGYEETHFPDAPLRNFAQENAGAGVKSEGYFKGEVVAGMRRTHLLQGSASKTQPYLRASLTHRLGRRFQLSERYDHLTSVSAFAVDGNLPTFENRGLNVDLAIVLTNRIDMKIGGARTRLLSDDPIEVILDSGETALAKRDDLVYEARADLGIRLGRARVSAFVSYTTRESVYFSDFGIQGLLLGARVEYAPK